MQSSDEFLQDANNIRPTTKKHGFWCKTKQSIKKTESSIKKVTEKHGKVGGFLYSFGVAPTLLILESEKNALETVIQKITP